MFAVQRAARALELSAKVFLDLATFPLAVEERRAGEDAQSVHHDADPPALSDNAPRQTRRRHDDRATSDRHLADKASAEGGFGVVA